MVSVKRYLWLVYLVLIAAGVYIGADLFWAVLGSQMQAASRLPASSPSAAAETAEKRAFQQYTIIQERNLFGGKGRTAGPPPAPRTPPPTVAPTRAAANLKLVGTVVGVTEQTYAVIEDLGTKRQDLYRLGDPVREAKLVEITRNRVVLDTRGRRQELVSFEKPEATPPSADLEPRQLGIPRRPPAPQSPQEPREREQEQSDAGERAVGVESVGANVWRLSRDDLVEQMETVAQSMNEALLTPHFRAGQADGFMITNLPHNSFLAQLGLRNGDIMKGINGQRFGSLEEVFQMYQQLQSEPMLQLEIERGNQTEILTYEIH